MNDGGRLVDRLRGHYVTGINGRRDFSPYVPPISIEAANEIERLEKALNFIVNVRDRIKRKSGGEKWCIEIAKKTLNGEELTP